MRVTPGMRRPKRFLMATLTLLTLLIIFGKKDFLHSLAFAAHDPSLRFNHLQIIGTHNSYKLKPSQPLLELIKWYDLSLGQSLAYTHRPLKEQLASLGIRQIELDLFYDPKGGHFANPVGPQLAGLPPKKPRPEMLEPGIKVLHVQDFDFRSHCLTFKSCLNEIKEWSDENPNHIPLMVLLEAKDERLKDPLHLGFTVPFPISREFMESIDKEILSVFPKDQILTPDSVRGDYESLESAILETGWPLLMDVQGKVMFALDNAGKARDFYIEGHKALRGRIMFTNSPRGTPEAAFIKMNFPLGSNKSRIKELVQAGYLVRTRADSDTWHARTNNYEQKNAAIESGAHFISTDFPLPAPDLGSFYHVSFLHGKKFRCNPISAPLSCKVNRAE